MKANQFPQKAWHIILNDGITEFIRRAFLWTFRKLKLIYLITILKLMSYGRSYHDAKWLLDNKSDRQDALIGQRSTWDTYHGRVSRESHLARYEFAAQKLDGFSDSEYINVLDVASGTGYGSRILEKSSDTVINHYGCEIDLRAIKYSQKNHPSSYIQANAENLPFKSNHFQAVVSLETIEHIPDIDSYLQELRRVSTVDSKLIISTPYDENINIDVEHGKNYPHLHTFNLAKVEELFNKHFPESSVNIYVQFKRPPSNSQLDDKLQRIQKLKSKDIICGDYFLIHIER